jgi:tetratricopeptide (TPR) repeat protein
MLDNLSSLWESWLDKASWIAIVAIFVIIGVMLYTHQPELNVNPTPAHASVRATNRFVLERSAEVEKALTQTAKLYNAKKYNETIAQANKILQMDKNEPFAYLYLARAYRELDNLDEGITNYSQAIRLHPDFVDKKSEDFLGRNKKELKPYVDRAITVSRSKEFRSKPNYKKVLKHIYYLQRRMAGGCE